MGGGLRESSARSFLMATINDCPSARHCVKSNSFARVSDWHVIAIEFVVFVVAALSRAELG